MGRDASFASLPFLIEEGKVVVGAYDRRSFLFSLSSFLLRLVDEHVTLLMLVLQLDYLRRDLAIDHGSDRFSIFLDYGWFMNSRRTK